MLAHPLLLTIRIALKKQFLQKSVMSTKQPITKNIGKDYLDLLFTTKFNTPLNSQIVCDAIKKIIDEINLTRDYVDEMELFSAHCFRHTFATRCFEAGIQPKTVQTYLGHATLQMTMDLYTSVMPKQLNKEMDRISDVFDYISEDGDNIAEKQFDEIMTNSNKVIKFNGDTMVI